MDTQNIIDPTPVFRRKRYYIIFLAFLGFVNMYTTRVSFSVVIDTMVEEFGWGNHQRGFALGAFFYGYIATQIVGGIVAGIVGGHWLFGLGILGTGLFTIATPAMTRAGGFPLLMTSRIIQGLLSGLAFPAINDVYSSYSPPWERSRTASYGIAGIFVGTIIAYAMSGWLTVSYGWEMVFYVFGIVTVFWYFFWLTFVRSGPENDRLMSEGEKNFIREALKGQNSNIAIPWRSLFTSGPVYTIAFTHFCFNWGYYTLLTELPRYMVAILEFELNVGGYLSAIPFVFQMVFVIFTAWFADYLLIQGKLTLTQVRKYFNNSALIIQALFLFIASFIYDANIVVVSLIALAVGASALAMPGFLSNSLDLAPQFSSIILGISNTFATIPGFASPSLTAFIIPDLENPTAEQYRIVFMITCVIFILGAIVYGLFATAELQPWAVLRTEEDPAIDGYTNETLPYSNHPLPEKQDPDYDVTRASKENETSKL